MWSCCIPVLFSPHFWLVLMKLDRDGNFNGIKFHKKLYRTGDRLDSSLKGVHLGMCKDEITETRLPIFLFFKVLLVCGVCFPLYKCSLYKLPFTKPKSSLFLDVISEIPVLPWTPTSLVCGILHDQCKCRRRQVIYVERVLSFSSCPSQSERLCFVFCDVAFTTVCV